MTRPLTTEMQDEPLASFTFDTSDVWDTRDLGYRYDEPDDEDVRFVPKYRPDDPSGPDQLDIMPSVRAFARTIAWTDLKPPMSIGLFGDWGSGKTFFMEKIAEEINGLAEAQSDTDEHVFCERVAQIRFNAWHYAEGNLWASMVEHIFDHLERDGEPRYIVEERRREIMRRLELEQAARQRVAAQARAAQGARQAAKAQLTTATGELEAKRQNRDGLTGSDVWAAIGDMPEVKQAVESARAALSEPATDLTDSARDLDQAVDETLGVLRRGWALLTVKGGRWSFWQLLAPLVVLAGAAVLVWVLATVEEDTVAAVTALVAPMATGLTAGAAWMRKQSGRLGSLLAPVERARSVLDERYEEELRNHEEQVRAAEADVAAAERLVQMSAAELADADRRVAEVRRELSESTTARMLAEFVEDRAVHYREHLGLIAMIRRDFETLTELMDPEMTDPPLLDEASSNLVHAEFSDELRLQRIVLYIDDLDRCPPERVIEVIQAVHLMLAFPLFVVVVAVDPRWMIKALEKEFPLLESANNATPAAGSTPRSGRGDNDSSDRTSSDEVEAAGPDPSVQVTRVLLDPVGKPATPYDYLEKIFQVPFWLKPMNANGAGALLAELVPGATTSASSTGAGTTGDANDAPLDSEAALRALRDAAARRSDLDLAAKNMELDEEERQALAIWRPLLTRSPRAVKRFVNVYQLIRAGLTPEQHDTWLEGPPGDAPACHATMLLLATVSGATESAEQIFQLVTQLGEHDSLEELNDVVGDATTDITGQDKLRWAEAMRNYGEVRELSDLSATQLQAWLPVVSQYSFRHAATL